MKSTSDQRENKESGEQQTKTTEEKKIAAEIRARKQIPNIINIYLHSFVNSYGAQRVCDAFILYFFVFFSFCRGTAWTRRSK